MTVQQTRATIPCSCLAVSVCLCVCVCVKSFGSPFTVRSLTVCWRECVGQSGCSLLDVLFKPCLYLQLLFPMNDNMLLNRTSQSIMGLLQQNGSEMVGQASQKQAGIDRRNDLQTLTNKCFDVSSCTFHTHCFVELWILLDLSPVVLPLNLSNMHGFH